MTLLKYLKFYGDVEESVYDLLYHTIKRNVVTVTRKDISMRDASKSLLTVEEVAEYLRVKVSTIYNWTHVEYIPHIKLGRVLRFRRDDIDKWLTKKTKKGRLIRLPSIELD